MWQKLGTVLFWLTWPGLWLYVRGTTRTRVLIRVGDEILVTRTWLSDGRWSLPGGGLHRGEKPLDGIIRELKEETAVELSPEDIHEITTSIFRYHGLSFPCHYFAAELPTKPIVRLQRFEISGSKWVKSDEISSADYGPDVIEAIRHTPTTL